MKKTRFLILFAVLTVGVLAVHAQDGTPRSPRPHDDVDVIPIQHADDHAPPADRHVTDDMPAAPLRVHEWGVWHLGPDGRVDSLASLAAESPPFVHRAPTAPPAHEPDLGPVLPPSSGEVFDKPVVFLYADTELDVTVRVRVPHGRPWLYFPDATVGRIGGDRGLRWTGHVLLPGAPVRGATLEPVGNAAHWWNRLRAVGASPFVPAGATRYEPFLFYDGEAPFPAGFRFPAGELVIRGTALWPIAGHVEPIAWVVGDGTPGRLDIRGATSTRTALHDLGEVRTGLRAQLIAEGLCAAEADSLLGTWNAGLFDGAERRVIWLLPRASYDAMLPIDVSPTPLELVRVGVVIQAFAAP